MKPTVVKTLTSDEYLNLIVQYGTELDKMQIRMCKIQHELAEIRAEEYPTSIEYATDSVYQELVKLRNRIAQNLSYRAVEQSKLG